MSFSTKMFFWIELGFLVFLTFIKSIISDLEYSAYEEHNILNFSRDIGYRVVGLMSLMPYGLYYWGFLKRFVFRRSLAGILFCSVCFVVADHLYSKYAISSVIANAGFISEGQRDRALEDLARPVFPITFNYPIISAIVPLTGLAFFIRSLTQDRQMRELKEQQLMSELNYLKAQLHPHFFFNTINNIYSLALTNAAQTAPMIAKLGEMMRYILYEADQPTVLLTKEVAFLANYIGIERIRHHENIRIEFDIQGIRPDYRIPPLLLLPLVENAFKHGIAEETADGFVNIVICQTESEIILNVTNSRPPADRDSSGKGIGLQNISKRLDLLYHNKHRLDINDHPGYYQTTLTLQTI